MLFITGTRFWKLGTQRSREGGKRVLKATSRGGWKRIWFFCSFAHICVNVCAYIHTTEKLSDQPQNPMTLYLNPLYNTYYLQIPIAYDVCVLLSLIDLKFLEMKSWASLNYGWMKQFISYLYRHFLYARCRKY